MLRGIYTETAAGLVKSALEGGFFPGSGSVAAAFSAAAARSEVTVAAAEKEGQNEENTENGPHS